MSGLDLRGTDERDKLPERQSAVPQLVEQVAELERLEARVAQLRREIEGAYRELELR